MHKQTKKWKKYNYLGRRKPFIAVTISFIHTVLAKKCNKLTLSKLPTLESMEISVQDSQQFFSMIWCIFHSFFLFSTKKKSIYQKPIIEMRNFLLNEKSNVMYRVFKVKWNNVFSKYSWEFCFFEMNFLRNLIKIIFTWIIDQCWWIEKL